MRLDLHNHTRYSPDSRATPGDVVASARRNGLHGVAITDHNSIAGVPEAKAKAGGDFLVVPGVEVSTKSGHVLAYGIREAIPRDATVAETVERIVAAGGVAVAAHPYRFWSGLGEASLSTTKFPAYETCNARTLSRGNERARTLARTKKVGETGGSDSHFLAEVGTAWTEIDAGTVRVDDVIQMIGQRRTLARGADRGATATVRYVTKCVGQWILRGMRRI